MLLLKAIAAPSLILVLSTLGAAAQSSGEVRLPPVTGEAENWGPPVIQSLTYRSYSPVPNGDGFLWGNGADWGFAYDFHFIAPEGNAVYLEQRIIKRDSDAHWSSGKPIEIPADSQKSGAVVTMRGLCSRLDNNTAELDAYIVDAHGNHSNTVRYTVHCGGTKLPYVTQRLQIGGANETTVAIPHTGTEEALRSFIEGWEKGKPPYEIMAPKTAPSIQTQSAAIKKQIDDWGKLKSIAFKTVNDYDLDVYSVEFEHGESIWWVPQLTLYGKIPGLGFTPSTADTTPVAAHNEQSSPVPPR
jgi:hypothetical protein